MPAGRYYLLVVTDYNNAVAELNEDNNVSRKIVNVRTLTRDLSSADLHVLPLLYPGQFFELKYTEINKGDQASENFSDRVMFSVDTILDDQDTRLAYTYFSRSADSETEVILNMNLPENIAPGDYYLLLQNDWENRLNETNENNNISYVKISAVSSQPDLETYFEDSETEIVIGKKTSYNIFVRNKGITQSTPSILSFYISEDNLFDKSDSLVFSTHFRDLSPGSAVKVDNNFALPGYVRVGQHYLLAIADKENLLEETDENNNIASWLINVKKALPDLFVTQLTSDSGMAFPDRFSYVLANNSSVTAPPSVTQFYLSPDGLLSPDDYLLGEKEEAAVPAGNRLQYYFSVKMSPGFPSTPGNYFVIAKADSRNTVAESDENNNFKSENPVYRLSQVDFSADSLIIYGGVVYTGDAQFTSAYSSLKGSSGSWANTFTFYFSTDSVLSETERIFTNGAATRPSGGEYPIWLDIPDVAEGTYYIGFKTDTPDEFSEPDEQNNICITKVSVKRTDADFQLSGLDVSADKVFQQQAFSVKYNLFNAGKHMPKVFDHRVGFYLSKDSVFNRNSDLFLTDAYTYIPMVNQTMALTQSVTIPASVASGNYYLFVVADNTSEVLEINENNNALCTKIRVGNTNVNLAVTDLSVSENIVVVGNVFSISSVVVNTGTDTSEVTSVKYYFKFDLPFLTQEYLIGTHVVGRLAPGAQSLSEISYSVPSYSYYKGFVYAVADKENIIAETNESDNVKYSGITIRERMYDLTVENSTLSDNPVKRGDKIRVTTVFGNGGTVTFPSCIAAYYLSSDPLFSADDKFIRTWSVPSVPVNGTTTVCAEIIVPSGVVPGKYYLIAKGDGTSLVQETDETNNKAILALEIKPGGGPKKKFAYDVAEISNTSEFGISTAGGDNEILSFEVSDVADGDQINVVVYTIAGSRLFAQGLEVSGGRFNLPVDRIKTDELVIFAEHEGRSDIERVIRK
jgi:subtilase family serine protease